MKLPTQGRHFNHLFSSGDCRWFCVFNCSRLDLGHRHLVNSILGDCSIAYIETCPPKLARLSRVSYGLFPGKSNSGSWGMKLQSFQNLLGNHRRARLPPSLHRYRKGRRKVAPSERASTSAIAFSGGVVSFCLVWFELWCLFFSYGRMALHAQLLGLVLCR